MAVSRPVSGNLDRPDIPDTNPDIVSGCNHWGSGACNAASPSAQAAARSPSEAPATDNWRLCTRTA